MDERGFYIFFYKIQLIIPVRYKITDYSGEEIQGSFYEQEIQRRHILVYKTYLG